MYSNYNIYTVEKYKLYTQYAICNVNCYIQNKHDTIKLIQLNTMIMKNMSNVTLRASRVLKIQS